MKVSQQRRNLEKMSLQDMEVQLNDQRQELFRLRFDYARGQVKNCSLFKKIKKQIARLHTVMTQRKNQK